MNRNWQQYYEAGVPKGIDFSKVVPLTHYLAISASDYPESPALTNFGCSLSYRELDIQSRAFAAGLVEGFGLDRGDRVAIMLPNLLQFPIAFFGILRAGMVVVNVNPLYAARELEHQLIDSGAKAIIVLENFAHVLEKVIEATSVEKVIVTRAGDCLPALKGILINTLLKYVKKSVPPWALNNSISYKAFIQRYSSTPWRDAPITLDDIALLQYTGGTTGRAKGAVLSHGNIGANIQQGLSWCNTRFRHGAEIAITALPLYHIFALTANLMFMVATAGNCVLITNPRDFTGFVKELRKWKMTYITGVNTLYAALMETSGFEKVDFSELKIAMGAGMAVTKPIAKRWHAVTGKPLLEVYGLSETSPAVCLNRLDLEEYNGYVGLPIPDTDIKVIDENEKELGPDEEGELCVKGPQVMQGYWRSEEETRAVFTKDGFFKTGDYALINPQGYVKILDRKKDMILVSGFNVYPNEIEDVVADHPDVLQVAAIGIEDKKSGQRVKLYVTPRTGSENPPLTEERLIQWCRQNMAHYKVPKEVEFKERLPLSNVGKILRRELR